MAIWAAPESSLEKEESSVREAYILGAAMLILHFGQSLFKLILFPGEVLPDILRSWKTGPLHDGKPHLTLERWHFWRERYNAVSVSDKEDSGFGLECKKIAARTANMMDALEENMTFYLFRDPFFLSIFGACFTVDVMQRITRMTRLSFDFAYSEPLIALK